MAERYTRLYSLPENLYQLNAPVLISAGALLKDNQTGSILAQIRLKNIDNKIIKAITIYLKLYDIANRELEDGVEYQYLDLELRRDQMYGQKVPIILDNSSARSYKVYVKEVIFEDNTIWEGDSTEWVDVISFTPIIAELTSSEIVKQYCIEIGAKTASFCPEKEYDLWVCVCGAINHREEERCHVCSKYFITLQNALNNDNLAEAAEKRIAKEKALAEATRVMEEEEKRRVKTEKDKLKDEKQKRKEDKKNAKNKFSKVLKLLVLLQVTLFVIGFSVAGFVSFNSLVRIFIIVGTILILPCVIFSILSLKTAIKSATKKGLKTGILLLIFELLWSAFIVWSVFFFTEETASNVDSPKDNISITESADSTGTDWNSHELIFIGDIPVSCLMVPDATPEVVANIMKEKLNSDKSFSASRFGSKQIKKKMVIENVTVGSVAGTVIFNFDWDDSLFNIVFKFDDDTNFTPKIANELHQEISNLVGEECQDAELGYHEDAKYGEGTSCAWFGDTLESYLSTYFYENGMPDNCSVKFTRTVCDVSENLSVPTTSDTIIIDGVKISGSYHDVSSPYIEGTATNISNKTAKSIRVKVSLYDEASAYGEVIDTDWFYAVGSEGLAPGETTKWKEYVSEAEAIEFSKID